MNTLLPKFKGIMITALMFTFLPCSIPSQEIPEFNFHKDWTWEELTEYAVLIDPSLLILVDEQKRKISISDMRILLRELSGLHSMTELSNLGSAAAADPDNDYQKKIYWDSVFKNSFGNLTPEINLRSMLEASVILADIRIKNLPDDKFGFHERDYLYQPIKPLSKKINLGFDFDCAEKLLNYYDTNGGDAPGISNCRSYSELLNDDVPSDFSMIEFRELVSLSESDNPTDNIYKWVNPQSYKDLGGVYVYRRHFGKVINTLKNNEENIRSDADKNISKYLEDNVRISSDVLFSFGNFYDEDDFSKSSFVLPLENFGDNYGFIVKYIIHNTVKISVKEIQIPVFEFVPEFKDRLLVSLLIKLADNGIANYIGAVGTETRPRNLLEKDFTLFNKAYGSIHKNEPGSKTDSLINIGFSGNAPFYTMSTQMAYIIETTLGRNSLKESISLGPVSFFAKYIKAYKEYPDEIRKVFRFSKPLEQKIFKLTKMFPDDVIKEALKIRNSRGSIPELKLQVENFVGSGNHSTLKNFLGGQILLKSGLTGDSKKYFTEGINLKKDKADVCGLIGRLFEKEGDDDTAMEFYDMNIEHSKKSPGAYELRGNLFYKKGNREKALDDYKSALKLNPGLHKLQRYVKVIESKDE